MSHSFKFIHISGDDVKVSYDASDFIGEKRGAVIRVEYGSDGKVLSTQILKQNGVFEPTFTLRAGDVMAASFVRHYADVLEISGANQEKVISAQASARTFEDYDGPRKLAD